MASNSVDFVDENDAGCILLTLLKQVAHSARADAYEHFDEVRTGDGKERNIGLAGNCTCQQGLAGSRRSNQKNALGNPSAKLLEFLRFAQELDNFPQLFLGFIHPSHIFESDFLLLHGEQAGPALTE